VETKLAEVRRQLEVTLARIPQDAFVANSAAGERALPSPASHSAASCKTEAIIGIGEARCLDVHGHEVH
jgi:hypothetical protein